MYPVYILFSYKRKVMFDFNYQLKKLTVIKEHNCKILDKPVFKELFLKQPLSISESLSIKALKIFFLGLGREKQMEECSWRNERRLSMLHLYVNQ